MSDLQVSLLLIGAIVVVSVYLFNWWQERRYRQKLNMAARQEEGLLEEIVTPVKKEPESSLARQEPKLGDALPTKNDTLAKEETCTLESPLVTPREVEKFKPDPRIDYVIEIRSDRFLPTSDWLVLLEAANKLNKPVYFLGLNNQRLWERLASTATGGYSQLQIIVQLVDRIGCLGSEAWFDFYETLKGFAAEKRATLSNVSAQEVLNKAAQVDQFCAEVDVSIGLNVVSPVDGPLLESKIFSFCELEKIQLLGDGNFYCFDESGEPLFAITRMDNTPFTITPDHDASLEGVTFLLEVPRVKNGLSVLTKMHGVAKRMAAALNGKLVDDNRSALTDRGILKIQTQLKEIYRRMDEYGVSAGNDTALRLFSNPVAQLK